MLPSSHLHPEPYEQKVPGAYYKANPITKCLNSFSTTELKLHDQSDLSWEGFIWVYGSRGHQHHRGEARQQVDMTSGTEGESQGLVS